MVIGIGTDIIEVSRISKNIENETFLTKIFTKNEIAYCKNKNKYALHLAARFAAKEAVAKAFGTGFSNGIQASDIEIYNDDTGAPHVKLYGKTLEIFQQKKVFKIHISLSHLENYATACAVIENSDTI